MTWTRESLLAAAKAQYPHIRECFLTPMVELYLSNPEKLKEIVKADMKREAKKAKQRGEEPEKQTLFEFVSVAPPENLPVVEVVEQKQEREQDDKTSTETLA